jgi:homogentisate 1,2-dioxygenase
MPNLATPNRFTDVEGYSPDAPATPPPESAQPAAYPYETRLNILHGPLELIDVNALAADCRHKWFNQTLCKVNDSVVRAGIIEGEYHWHKHDKDDEFFYVVDGRLLIDLESRTVELAPGQGFVVPRATMHRTRAPQRTIILMVENAGIIPTGN